MLSAFSKSHPSKEEPPRCLTNIFSSKFSPRSVTVTLTIAVENHCISLSYVRFQQFFYVAAFKLVIGCVYLCQLTAAMYEIHEIFFELPVGERMALIEQTRALERERFFKSLVRVMIN